MRDVRLFEMSSLVIWSWCSVASTGITVLARISYARILFANFPRSFVAVNPEDVEEIRAAQKEMYQALKARKEALEAQLKKKTDELKLLCLKEAVSEILTN